MTLILNGTDNSATTPAVTGTDTDTGVYYPAANQVAIATSGTQAMLANASQGVQFANAIGVGATTPTTSGAGITFPATQSASSNANTLDDYEEGTWNPIIQNVSGSESITLTGAGNYIKCGRIVWVGINAYATNSSAISAGNHIFMRGLPFEAATITGAAQYVGSVMSQYPAQPVSLIDIASTTAPMYAPSSAQDWTPFTRNTWGGQTSISWRMSFCYMASA